jgi:predicted MPP superfamily phosphohydrolase
VVAFATPVAALAFGGIVERNRYRVREVDLPITGLHPDLDGFSITQVSDLHVSPFLSAREAGRVIDLANELKGDLAIFTGDLISEAGDPLDDAIRELVRLQAPEGVLGCMGNHEQYTGCRNYLERQARRAGLVFLRDTTRQIHSGGGVINFAGVDYQRRTKTVKYLAGTERHILAGTSNILLSHNPDVFPAAIDRGFQAVISGHTHGGQVNVEILHQNVNPARFRTPFISGLYQQRGASCFVTNGIGTIGLPVRLGAPPEVALLRLRRA